MAKKKKKKEDIDFEIKFYEGVVKNNPDFIDALSVLGDLYTKKGLFKKGLEIDEKLYHLRPTDPIVLYNLACSYSLLDKLDDSLKMIKLAIENGYDDLYYLEQDDDLMNLRNDKRFQRYFAKLVKKKSI